MQNQGSTFACYELIGFQWQCGCTVSVDKPKEILGVISTRKGWEGLKISIVPPPECHPMVL